MSPWIIPYNDLVLSRLVTSVPPESVHCDNPAAAMALLTNAPRPTVPNSVRHVLRRPGSGAHASLVVGLQDYATAVSGGISSLTGLHLAPDREILQRDGRSLLLRARTVEGRATVLAATWKADLLANGAPRDAVLVDIDEYQLPHELRRLERTLTSWARDTSFVPEHPILCLAAVALPDVTNALDGIESQLRAVAAVLNAEVDFFVADHNRRDARAHDAFQEIVLSNRHDLLVTLSHADQKWVWKLARRFENDRRTFRVLPITSVADAADELANVLPGFVAAAPERPTEFWGPAALQRVDSRVCESFALSDRARSHLKRNPYPNPERMLDHLERLADCADAWRRELGARKVAPERLADWAMLRFGLSLALHDHGIKEKDATFEFDGQQLDSRPHVKVDDFVAPNACGRIYFGIDDRRSDGTWRFVVDHIGLHDRS
jgi:hypothetical protein